MNTPTWMLRLLTLGLAAGLSLTACGGDDPEDDTPDSGQIDADAGDSGEPDEDTGEPQEDAGDDTGEPGGDDGAIADFEWAETMMYVRAYPDRAVANGNEEVDPAQVPVEFTAELVARPTEDDEALELPITTATVRIGLGDEGASSNEDFTWIDLTHQGGGVYTAETTGTAAVYRASFEGSILTTRLYTDESEPYGRIIAPVDGQTYPATADIPVDFEPIGGTVFAVLSLNDTEIERSSRAADQEEFAIPSSELSAGTHEVNLLRFHLSGTETGGIVREIERSVSIVVE